MANESENTLPIIRNLVEWREPTPDASDEGSSDSDGSIEYKREEHLTPWPQKRPHGEEEDVRTSIRGPKHEILAWCHE